MKSGAEGGVLPAYAASGGDWRTRSVLTILGGRRPTPRSFGVAGVAPWELTAPRDESADTREIETLSRLQC